MATHNDATGCLFSYRHIVIEVWFHAICNHANRNSFL